MGAVRLLAFGPRLLGVSGVYSHDGLLLVFGVSNPGALPAP